MHVIGEVLRPGAVQLAANSPLIQGILAAGAADWRSELISSWLGWRQLAAVMTVSGS